MVDTRQIKSIQDIDIQSPEKTVEEDMLGLDKLENERRTTGKKLMKNVE